MKDKREDAIKSIKGALNESLEKALKISSPSEMPKDMANKAINEGLENSLKRNDCKHYNANDDVYPLCKGSKEMGLTCHICCVYEDYERYNGDEYYKY